MYQQSGNEKDNHGKNGCVHAESRSVKEEWQGVEIVTDGTHICNILVKGWHRALLNLCAFLLILEISQHFFCWCAGEGRSVYSIQVVHVVYICMM